MTNIPDKHIERFKKLLSEANQNIAAAEELLFSVAGEDLKSGPSHQPELTTGKVVEGIFNGYKVVGDDGKDYPVQANYASKSRLVQGDRMKLTISPEGGFTFKQISPVGRIQSVGNLAKQEGNFFAVVGDRRYQVLLASVTHHKLHEGDQVSVSLPDDNPDATWAAIEAPL